MKVMIVDDHAMFREGLRLVLEQLPQQVELVEARSLSECLSAIERNRDFDLLLLDLMLPDARGLSGLEAVREAAPDLPVVILSASEDGDDMVAAIERGAMGYIPKASSTRILLGALQLVLNGGIYVPPSLITNAPAADARQRTASSSRDNAAVALTKRQREILMELTKGKSNKEIARDLNLAEGTVKIHVTAVLKALRVRNRMQAVLKASSLKFS